MKRRSYRRRVGNHDAPLFSLMGELSEYLKQFEQFKQFKQNPKIVGIVYII